MPKNLRIAYWIAKLAAAFIMFQTLFFKFTAAEESVALFTKLGIEPFGRIGIGVMELIASILLFTPRFSWVGAGLAVGLMSGAIFAHLTMLGVAFEYTDSAGIVHNDKGSLFFGAVVALIASLFILYVKRIELLGFINKVLGRNPSAQK